MNAPRAAASRTGAHRAWVRRHGVLEPDDVALTGLADLICRPDTTVWVDVVDPSSSEMAELAVAFGFADDAGDAGGVVAHSGRKFRRPPSYVSASLAAIDVVLDHHIDCLDGFYDHYDEVAEKIRSEIDEGYFTHDPARAEDFFVWRHSLSRLRRRQLPLVETVGGLIWNTGVVPGTIPDPPQSDELALYRRDLRRRLPRIEDEIEAIRGVSDAVNDAVWSMRDYQQELIAKKVSGWLAIFAVPAILTGWFGMNVPYPGSGKCGVSC